MAGLNPDGQRDRAARRLDVHRADGVRALVVLDAHAEAGGGGAAHGGRVVPRHLRDRVRRLLHPRVVGERAVVERRAEADDEFDLVAFGDLIERDGAGGGHALHHRVLGVGHVAVVEHRPPAVLEGAGDLAAPQLSTERLAHEVVAGDLLPRREQVDDLDLGVRVGVERRDKRLDDGERAVVGAAVAPHFEVVRARQVPGGELRRLVAVGRERDARRHLRHRLGKVQRGGRVVGRVDADGDERAHLAAGHLAHELLHGLGLRRLLLLAGVVVAGDAAAEAAVEARAERVHGGRLRGAGDEERAAARGLGVGDDGGDHRVGLVVLAAVVRRLAEARGDGGGEAGDAAGLHPLAVVGHAAGGRVLALDHVEAAHAAGPACFASFREAAAVLDRVAGLAAQEVGVEGDDDGGVLEVVRGAKIATQRAIHPDPRGVVAGGAVGDPAGAGAFHLLAQAEQRRAGRGLAEHDGAGTEAAGLARAARKGDEVGPGRGLRGLAGGAARANGAGAVGVVEVEHAGLREHVRRALAHRVLGVALDLGRAPFVALDQQALQDAAHREGRRVVVGDAGDDLLGLAGVRQDLLLRAAAAGEAGHRHRRAHHLHKGAAARAVVAPEVFVAVGAGVLLAAADLLDLGVAGARLGAAPDGGLAVGGDLVLGEDVELDHAGRVRCLGRETKPRSGSGREAAGRLGRSYAETPRRGVCTLSSGRRSSSAAA